MALNINTCPSKIPATRGVSIIVYADPGAGKTTLASTLPEEKTLFISTEAGIGPLLGTKHHVLDLFVERQKQDFNLFQYLDELYVYLINQNHNYKYVVLDNVSELEQWVIQFITNSRGKKFCEIKEYGDSAYKMRAYLPQFRDLIFKGITVIFNAWEIPYEIKNADGVVLTKTYPKISKKVAIDFCGVVDVVGHLEFNQKTEQRWLRIVPSDQYIAKCQFKGLDAIEKPNLKDILNKLYSYEYDKK